MDTFFQLQDAVLKLHNNVKKCSNYSDPTKKTKIRELNYLKEELKNNIKSGKFSKDLLPNLVKRYKHLRQLINESIIKLKGDALDETLLGNLFDPNDSQNFSSDSSSDDELENMPPKLDLNIALKVVKSFDGSAVNLQSYIESIELLKDYSEGVTPAELIKFLKVTLTGTARGAFDGVATVDAAIEALKLRFGVKITPKAVESEMLSKRQSNKTITDFGDEIAKLASKLAAAHVSQGTFASESAASNLVETVAVRAFTDGLKDQTTQFLLRARNPSTLNKAISDALECGPGSSKPNEMTLWFSNSNRGYHRGNSRGRGSQRGPRNSRGNYRGRGNYQGYNNNGYNNNGYNNNNHYNNNNSNNNNYRGNRRGRGNSHTANVVEEQQPRQQQQQQLQQNQQQQNNRQEDANLIDLFR